jgi:DNA-binding transcriptional LysR family regulator
MGNTSEVTAAVKAGAAEIGLIEWPTDETGIVARKMDEDEMVVVVSSLHPWASRDRPIYNLAETPWVLREFGSGTRLAFKRLLELHGIALDAIDVAMELPDNSAVVGAIELGLGATLISRSAAETAIFSGRISQAGIAPLPRPYFLLRNADRYFSKAAQAFENMVLSKTPSD